MAPAILDGMTLRIDQAGRIVLPKPLRDRLGLRAGSSLEVRESSDGIVLKVAGQHASMVKKKGLWVHTGKLPAGYDLTKAVQDDREDRIRRLAGL
jgi:AbrB family looped-hinge helix DNA binding protein